MMENLRNYEWERHWDQAPLMGDKVVVIRVLHWESDLVHNMKLREDHLVRFQEIEYLG